MHTANYKVTISSTDKNTTSEYSKLYKQLTTAKHVINIRYVRIASDQSYGHYFTTIAMTELAYIVQLHCYCLCISPSHLCIYKVFYVLHT